MMGLRDRLRSWLLSEMPPSAEQRLGTTGVRFSSGQIYAGEFNTDLRGSKAVAVYDQMRREASVASSIQLVNLPILSATWYVECEDEPVREFLEEALFKRIDFEAFLREAMLCFVYGFEVMELVWERQGRNLWLKSLEHLGHSSIKKWIADPVTGGLAGVEQQGYKGEAYGTFRVPDQANEMDARYKLFHVALHQEGNNFEGISGLRPAYPYWKAKVETFKIAAMALERFGLGIPMAEPPTDQATGRGRYSADEKDAATTMLKNIRAGAQAHIFNPGGWKFDILGADGSMRYDPMPFLAYCDEMIALNVLGEFTRLGVTRAGARAVADPQIGVYMLAEEAIAELIKSRVNAQLVRALLDLNFANAENIEAEVKWADLEASDTNKIAEYCEKLAAAKLLTYDETLEDHLREVGDLPDRDPDTAREEQEPEPVVPEDGEGDDEQDDADEEGQPRRAHAYGHGRRFREDERWARPLTEPERSVAFAEIDGRQDDTVEEIGRLADRLRMEWAAELGDQIMAALEDGEVSDVADIAVPKEMRRAREKETLEVLREVYAFGRQTIRDERRRQLRQAASDEPAVMLRDEDPDAAELRKMMTARVRRYWDTLADQAASVAQEHAMGLYRTAAGDVRPEDVAEVADDLSEMWGATARLSARVLASEALSLGRAKEADNLRDQIKHAEYSAILDGDACERCLWLDGEQYEVGTREYFADHPPNRQCLSTKSGANRCRCVWIYVFKTEEEAAR